MFSGQEISEAFSIAFNSPKKQNELFLRRSALASTMGQIKNK